MKKFVCLLSVLILLALCCCACGKNEAPVADGIYGEWKRHMKNIGFALDNYKHLILRRDHTGEILTTGDSYIPKFTFSYDEESITFYYVDPKNNEPAAATYPYRIEDNHLYIQAENREIVFEFVSAEPD